MTEIKYELNIGAPVASVY